jgi:tetratricopeptide (TPR) repeat protein
MLKKACLLLLALALIPWISQAEITAHFRTAELSFGRNHLQDVIQATAIPEDEYRIIPRNSNLADVYYNRGNSYINSSQYAEAIKYYDQAINHNPDLADAYFNRGNAYSYLGRHQQAEVDYSRVIRLDPYSTNAYYNRGLAYLALGQLEYACSDFEKACQLGNCSALSWSEEKGLCQ